MAYCVNTTLRLSFFYRGLLCLFIFLGLWGCDLSETTIPDPSEVSSFTLTIDQGFDFSVATVRDTPSNSTDFEFSIETNDPVFTFTSWGSIATGNFDTVSSINISESPSLTQLTVREIALTYPNLVIFVKTLEGHYAKLQISDFGGLSLSEDGLEIDLDTFYYTFDYYYNGSSIPEF